ncbi:hypothetical protein J6590_035842 [Homalodisca vitripennis]|nr:hypothetical protein J6590_035842 [Homalodisca vitripennis]
MVNVKFIKVLFKEFRTVDYFKYGIGLHRYVDFETVTDKVLNAIFFMRNVDFSLKNRVHDLSIQTCRYAWKRALRTNAKQLGTLVINEPSHFGGINQLESGQTADV